jgi:hypothetical protein
VLSSLHICASSSPFASAVEELFILRLLWWCFLGNYELDLKEEKRVASMEFVSTVSFDARRVRLGPSELCLIQLLTAE